MGYRSDVGIMCRREAYHMFYDAIKKHDFVPDEIKKGDDSYFIRWTFVKWDNWYEDVNAIEDVMRKLDEIIHDKIYTSENILDYSYEFIRIGENDEDIEQRSNTWSFDDFYVTRDFAYPSDMEDIEIK